MSSGTREGSFSLPVAPLQVVPAVTGVPRKQRSKSTTVASSAVASTSLAVSTGDSTATSELAATLEALATTEAAVKSAEESLEKLRASAKKLKQLAAQREAAIKQAAQHAPRQ
jgi:hypothetical protein